MSISPCTALPWAYFIASFRGQLPLFSPPAAPQGCILKVRSSQAPLWLGNPPGTPPSHFSCRDVEHKPSRPQVAFCPRSSSLPSVYPPGELNPFLSPVLTLSWGVGPEAPSTRGGFRPAPPAAMGHSSAVSPGSGSPCPDPRTRFLRFRVLVHLSSLQFGGQDRICILTLPLPICGAWTSSRPSRVSISSSITWA